jgi:polysaccharide deacetylase 2 family uncharacterized protein YibQ
MARRGDRPPIGISWIVTWPLSAVFAALVFLCAEQAQLPVASEVAPPIAADPNWGMRFPGRIAAIDAVLRKARLLPAPVEEERGSGPLRWTYRLYEVELRRERQPQAEAAIEAVRGADPGVTVAAENTTDATEVRIGLDGLLISTVRFLWREQPRTRPRVAVVIGPLGDDLREARQVVGIDAPVVLGVRPFRPFSRQVAELGRLFQREVVMQLDGTELVRTPSTDAASGGGDPARRLDAALATVPDAVGIAWPSASGKMDRKLFDEVERRNLLFVGERGGDQGETTGLPAASVIGITDGDPETENDALAAQLGAVAKKAQQNGRALAVAQLSTPMLAALQRALPEWRAAEIDCVSVSTLAGSGNLSAR